jgi:quinohemoprotein ethanol dehydrogenase
MGAAAVLAGGCSKTSGSPAAANAEGANWEHYGNTWRQDHFSPLTEINDQNVSRLGLAWSYDLPVGQSSGISGPLAVDGVLYFSVDHSVIHAMEAATGKLLWQYDPKVFEVPGEKVRAGWGVRGIAFADGKVFTGTLDGRLIAIDAKTGQVVWSVMTVDPKDQRYITGLPYIMKDKVIIGHGGSDYGPVRGYVTAYDIKTGKQAWRFYTVPATRPTASRTRPWRWPRRPGPANGGSTAAAARSGTPWPTTRSSITSIWAWATAHPTTRRSAAPAVATTCSSARSSR